MISKLIVLSIFLIAVTASLFGGGFQLNEHGARAMAQAGAFAARANDPAALYFNPAGISYLKGTNILIGATLVSPTITFRGPTDLNSNKETDLESKNYFPINVYAIQEINETFSAGIGINNPFGLGTKWPDDWVGKTLSIKSEVQVFNINPTVAAKFLDDKLSVAAGFDYSLGSVEIIKEVNSFYPPATVHLKAGLTDGHGMGYNLGVLYKPCNDMSFGASYRSPINLKIKGNATFSQNRSLFPEGEVTSTLNLPATAFIAGAYSPMEKLWIEFDAQFIGWSSYKTLDLTFKKDNSVSSSVKNYKDTWIFRLGGEYELNSSVTLSAGYLRDLNPVPDQTVDPILPDADRNGFCVGFSYKINEKISFDLAYMYLPFDQRTTEVSDQNFNGTYNTTTHLLGLNIYLKL
jgi:long-chain fatty acid transport protein